MRQGRDSQGTVQVSVDSEEKYLSMGDILRTTIRKAKEDAGFKQILAEKYNFCVTT